VPEITLESLAARVEALEQKLAAQVAVPPVAIKGWRHLIGTMEDNEFTRSMLAEIEAGREAERAAARSGPGEEPAT
jgi:hypothetical protein